MQKKSDLFSKEFDFINSSELARHAENNEKIRVLRAEAMKLAEQFLIVEKVGEFDDFYSREAPILLAKINQKRLEIASTIQIAEIEKAEQFKKASEASGKKQVKIKDETIGNFDSLIHYFESHRSLVLFFAGLFLIQAAAYGFLALKNKSLNAKLESAGLIETRLKLAEEKNKQLSDQIKKMESHLSFWQSLNTRMPQLASNSQSYQPIRKIKSHRAQRVESKRTQPRPTK